MGIQNVTINEIALNTNAYATNEKPIDMFDSMFENFPQLTPLVSILTKLSSDELANSRIDWIEQELLPTQVVVTAAATATEATLTIGDHFTYLRNHDFLYNPLTFELIKLEGFTTIDASVDVVRGWGATTGIAIASGTVLEISANSYYEASEESNPRSVVNTQFHNFTAEIWESVRTSKRVMNERTYFGGKGTKRLENQMKMFRVFKEKLERALLFSARADVASTESGFTSQNIKTMDGIVEKLKNGTNFLDVNGVFTESILDDWLTDIYTEMPDTTELVAFCAPHVYKTINRMAKPSIRISPNEKKYGMKLKRYEGAIDIDLIPHPLFGGAMSGWMFLLDLSKIKLFYQMRPQLELDVNVKKHGYIEDKYSAFITMLVAVEQRHAMAVNIEG